jgi:5-methylcytosine-specific restriction protein A
MRWNGWHALWVDTKSQSGYQGIIEDLRPQVCLDFIEDLRAPVERRGAFRIQGPRMSGWHKTSRHERGYGGQWVRLRAAILQRDMHLCQPCLRKGRPTPAQAVDHITPKAKGGTDDHDNLEATCHACHKAKTLAERGAKARVTFGADGWPL